MEHKLQAFVGFLIMPVFAFANAGVAVEGSLMEVLTQPVAMGIALGLILGKPIGVTFFSWLAIRTGLAVIPAGTGMRHIVGAGMIGGIGFTMSLFIAELAFAGRLPRDREARHPDGLADRGHYRLPLPPRDATRRADGGGRADREGDGAGRRLSPAHRYAERRDAVRFASLRSFFHHDTTPRHPVRHGLPTPAPTLPLPRHRLFPYTFFPSTQPTVARCAAVRPLLGQLQEVAV